MRLRNRDDVGNVSGLWLYAGLADWNVHVGCISLEMFHRTQRSEVFYALRLERVAIVTFKSTTLKSILDTSCVIFFGLDHLASQFNPLIPLGRKIVDIDDARVNQDANYIAI